MKWILTLFLLFGGLAEAQFTTHGRRGMVLSGDSVTYSHVYNVGSGSGDLTIDGNATSYMDNSIILIAPGTYGTISISNLNPTTKITVRNGNGTVIMDGMNRAGLTPNLFAGVDFTNCNKVLFTGDGKAGTTYGFQVIDQSYQPTDIDGVNKNITMQYVSYDNVSNYIISITNSSHVVWDNTDATVIAYNLKFLHLSFTNGTGQPFNFSQGAITTSSITNLHKFIEIASCNISSMDGGDMIYMGASDRYSVHDCQFINVNLTNNNDNGMVHAIGSGDFYNNYLSNCQGHAIRWWSTSFGTTPYTCKAYNNIYIGSRKYSPFEWQSTQIDDVGTPNDNVAKGPNTTYCNFIVANNTGGNLNYEHHTEFDACLVDNYHLATGSSVVVVNNLLYNTFTSNNTAGRMFQFPPMSDPNYSIITNNYEADNTAAVFNETTLVLGALSPEKNAGTSGHLQSSTDYHKIAWNVSTPSIGAVQ